MKLPLEQIERKMTAAALDATCEQVSFDFNSARERAGTLIGSTQQAGYRCWRTMIKYVLLSLACVLCSDLNCTMNNCRVLLSSSCTGRKERNNADRNSLKLERLQKRNIKKRKRREQKKAMNEDSNSPQRRRSRRERKRGNRN
jgi:hypothetical protein